ncbi:MAG: septation regulator SpoVG [Proteobacteria bacterium]|nr:septation regulator SpoVG [Pseudomonadota bacterium]
MKITDVKVFPVNEDKLKAYATITFDNSFIVRDLKVISGNKGFFIAMPSKKRKDGTFRDVAHPLNSETRKMIEDSVLEVYKKESTSGKAVNYEEEEAGGEEIIDIPSHPEKEEEPDNRTEEEPEKRAEENPTIEHSDDPDKDFGYEE